MDGGVAGVTADMLMVRGYKLMRRVAMLEEQRRQALEELTAINKQVNELEAQGDNGESRL